MKKLLLFIFSFIFFSSFAQLDREHWFAPMVDRSNQTNPYQSVYMSTNETTPFKVDIYSNNVIIGTRTLSKGNPQKFPVPRNYIITTSQANLFKPVPLGVYLKGDKPFFASLRFSVNQHAEIVTSKGTAGIGINFFTSPAPIQSSLSNVDFITSILATEDNTQVTINNFDTTVFFSDNRTRSNFNFILQKGQSYIIDGSSNYTENWKGFIGAKITSTKPISVTNGNFNGQYIPTFLSSTDILMDQSVPVDRLGKEFVLVKGNGKIYQTNDFNYDQNMERAFIVASVNNTNIYVNNETTPINAVPLNAGQSIVIGSEKYINQGNQQYNMFIRSTENIYLFQLLAGATSGNEIATGGYNYIPPLSCYLPKVIDEIGFVNENEGYKDNSYQPTSPTKLNIITEAGAMVSVQKNGADFPLTTTDGPYPVLGSSNWVTYSIARSPTGLSSVSGNIKVVSNKAVTAGISAGDGAVGYGGYFAGFSFIPLITKTDGECLPGVRLEVTEGFDSYEWLENVNGTYVPAPGLNNLFFYEPTQAGIYAVKVKQGSCPEIQTKDYKFYNCTTYTNYDYTTCTSQIVTPKFALSTQGINSTTIKIDTPPAKGIAVINGDGTITYTANPNATGADTFKFSFCGTGTIPDCETVQATINLNQIEKYDKILNSCSPTDTATYDLTSAAITPDATVSKKYFSDAAYTNQVPAGQLTNYNSAPGFVYVQLSNTYGCTATATIELKITAPPIVNPALYTITHCDEEIDGIIDGNYKVDLTTITPTIVQNPANFTTKYFATEAKAITGLPADVLTGNFVFTENTSVWIRVDSPATCPPVIKEVFLKIGTKAPLINLVVSKDVCDLLENNSEAINLNDYIPLFNTATGTTATYFETLTAAQNNTPTITAAQTITGNKTFYYRINVPGFCNEIGTLNIILSKGTATALLDSYLVCAGSSITLTAEDSPVYTAWSWKKGTVTISTTRTATLDAGVYTIEFTNGSGCIFKKTITVTNSPKPIVDATAFTTTYCDSNFDGVSDPVNFNTITPIIVTNFAANPGVFTVKYYLNAGDRDANNGNTIPNLTNFTFTVNITIYFRVDSPVCPVEKGKFDLKFNTSLILSSATASTTICDNNIDGTETISLANYTNLFTTETGVSARYFATLADARNNTATINVSQAIIGNKTFYYRFKKAGVCDAIGTLNILFKASTPTALLDSYTVCEGSSKTLTAESTYTAYLWKKGNITVSTTDTAILTAGVYKVSFTNSSGCIFTKNITILEAPKPIWKVTTFSAVNCDENFDGIIKIKFSDVTPLILPNFASFTVEYSLFPNFSTVLPDDWTYSDNTTVHVRAVSQFCPTETKQIDFKFENYIPLKTDRFTATVCDDDFDGIKSVNLSSYLSEFTTDAGVTITYFSTKTDAQNNINAISSNVSVNTTGIYYLRLRKNPLCDVVVELTITIQKAKKSAILADQNICPDTTVVLDAGAGFDGYLWSTGEKTQVIKNVGVADYWVDLYSNGCVYRQTVSITPVELPEITRIDIQGSTVTVNASGGNPPYRYAIDNFNYQTSNVFLNVPGGNHTIYVISADNCEPVSVSINVIQLYNVITPNDDGINDVLNYSGLLKKDEPSLQIYDRFGKQVFSGDKSNQFSWDGKTSGRLVNTGSYWYIINWKEPGHNTFTQYSGWLLVKNRN